ncbi:flagellar biosynthesis protein FlhF [Piscinibacter koreensis]|uniref:Flagellar biosynthesis protein FlhF n=1 Tax=Piscinibacter koreensis TaxID=2742824 RepID=A0A7Y6NMJ5_9BURK|nr:flagellar biosynthesis protein FlhF [Schlegelella koreensis]NUZ05953.1 flagellar biosynthesis protein FlhF [Schlegelella koreensis]
MNLKRFSAKSTRDAMALVRQEFGDDAVVLSNKPLAGGGVEIVAMAPEGLRDIERMAGTLTPTSAEPAAPAAAPVAAPSPQPRTPAALAAEALKANPSRSEAFAARVARTEPPSMGAPEAAAPSVDEDVSKLEMSTLSFQDYVRTRMLKRRQAALNPNARSAEPAPAAPAAPAAKPLRAVVADAVEPAAEASPQALLQSALRSVDAAAETGSALEQRMSERSAPHTPAAHVMLRDIVPSADQIQLGPKLADELPPLAPQPAGAPFAAPAPSRLDQSEMINELRSMRGLIEERFGALAFMEKLQRQPAQARLTQKLLDCGFSPALIRKIAEGMPAEISDESSWVAGILERNLLTGEHESALEDQGGVYALVGPTGVGKTTSTAKIAAAFATKYGAANLGLITLDAYRVGAHEQLRAYGRILGVPVHTAHDRASLEDLLELLAGKKMVLIDTAGMAQRDSRTRELLDMLTHRSIQKLLVLNAASQGETIEDVLVAYRAAACRAVVLSKLDEAVKLGPALDALIRHKARVVGVANGQRVPEDWHRLSANALVQRALRGGGGSAYRLDASDVNLIFAAPRPTEPAGAFGG